VGNGIYKGEEDRPTTKGGRPTDNQGCNGLLNKSIKRGRIKSASHRSNTVCKGVMIRLAYLLWIHTCVGEGTQYHGNVARQRGADAATSLSRNYKYAHKMLTPLVKIYSLSSTR